MSTNYS